MNERGTTRERFLGEWWRPRLSTPRRRSTVYLLLLALWITAPFVFAGYLRGELSRRAFPVEAGTIAIPIMEFVRFWAVASPFAWAGAVFALWKYPGPVPLLAWNRARPRWSWLWTCLFLPPMLLFLLEYPAEWLNLLRHHKVFFAHRLLDVFTLLVLRASLVSRGRAAAPAPPSSDPA